MVDSQVPVLAPTPTYVTGPVGAVGSVVAGTGQAVESVLYRAPAASWAGSSAASPVACRRSSAALATLYGDSSRSGLRPARCAHALPGGRRREWEAGTAGYAYVRSAALRRTERLPSPGY